MQYITSRMSRAHGSPMRFMGSWTLAAIALATLPAAAASFASGPLPLVLVLLDGLLATAGMIWAEPRGVRAVQGMLAVQGVLVAAVLVLTRGGGFLIAMPLMSMTVLYLSPRVAVVVGGGIALLFGAVAFSNYPPAAAAQACAGVVSAQGFVAAFSRLLVRERATRAEVERLLGDLSQAHTQLAAQVTEIERLAAAQERNRIAREIHDGLGHTLTVASIQLEAAQLESAPRERIGRVQQVLREGLGELRRSVSMLRDDAVGARAFPDAIAQLVRDSSTDACAVRFATEGVSCPVSSALGFVLYRTAQEALTNARKHAEASRIEATLAYGATEVCLTISDDGRGAEQPEHGNGLAGLTERAALVGGTLEVRTRPGAGWELALRAPLNPPEELS